MSLESCIQSHRLIICCGSGGVGKTTLAAAIAVKAALLGKKVVVLTIDPAKRLANSLGLSRLENEEREISPQEFSRFGLRPQGRLFALMLDTKRTFDKVVERYAPDAQARQAILNNSLYQHLSNMIAGSQEYMAMEKVYELYQKKDYDLLVLDTPPTQHALDFLDAPQKMVSAVGDSMLKWFLKPSLFIGRTSLKLIGRGTRRIFKILDRIVGFEFLQDLSAMLISTAGLLEGFRERARDVEKLLRNPRSAFLLVTVPKPFVIDEAIYFYQKILESGLPFAGFVLNRVHPEYPVTLSEKRLREAFSQTNIPASKQEAFTQLIHSYQILSSQDQDQLKRLKKESGSPSKLTSLIPYFESDVHDLGGLAQLGEFL